MWFAVDRNIAMWYMTMYVRTFIFNFMYTQNMHKYVFVMNHTIGMCVCICNFCIFFSTQALLLSSRAS